MPEREKQDALAEAIRDTLTTLDPHLSENINVVAVLQRLVNAIQKLGNADADHRMGALEAHGNAILDSAKMIEKGLSDIAGAIDNLAEAIVKTKLAG